MRTVVVLSGKGGTGKTSVTASLAMLLGGAGLHIVLADTDVDAANLPLLLRPDPLEEHDFQGGEVAVVDPASCDGCSLCREHCRFGAITMERGPSGDVTARILPSCEGCAVCSLVCPREAISMHPRTTGRWSVGQTRLGTLVHGSLEPGGENSGKLVTRVRQEAEALARQEGASVVLVDGPPGTGCPVIAAMSGADLVVAVTEPTRSARSDLLRLLDLADHFGIETGLVLNKADLCEDEARDVEEAARRRHVTLLGRIPYDESIPRGLSSGRIAVECSPRTSEALDSINRRLLELLGPTGGPILPLHPRTLDPAQEEIIP